jgi:hypothetical protein
MAKRPHVKLNTRSQQERPEVLRFNYGPINSPEDEEKNYTPMVTSFSNCLRRLRSDRQAREADRNPDLNVPLHIDYIQIHFHGPFDLLVFNQIYYNEFGLEAVSLSEFNRSVLFSVVDQDKFNSFLLDIRNFILKESGASETAEYRGRVKYISEFKLLTTANVIRFEEHGALMNFQLTELAAGSVEWHEIYNSLTVYLTERGIDHRLVEEANILEVFNASADIIEEAVKNFDIVQSVTSSLSTVVSPSELSVVERGYGFEIENAGDQLPIIGILDTGISERTPLGPIIIPDDSFNLTSSSPMIDLADDGSGHGTAVAALAALGERPYAVEYSGTIMSDAKLLSMKIMDGSAGYVSMYEVLKLLERAKAKYPEIKLFVLTICFRTHKHVNEAVSPYAYLVDKFANENDCLLFICTTNNPQAHREAGYDLNYFSEEVTNLCAPAESMNNITVGASADNLRHLDFKGIAYGPEWPTLYSRKGHIDLLRYKKLNKRFTKDNPHLFKPDVITSGGDFEERSGIIGEGEHATMEVLSADPSRSFLKGVGTSFSTPLVANIAVQVQKLYPDLRSQSIKAIILNAASSNLIRFQEPHNQIQKQVVGHGLTKTVRSVFSSDNDVNFIVEDEIEDKQMKIYPLNFPKYLTLEDLGKENRILRVTATLCFSFEPELNNQMAYCPLHMAFSIFRNHSGADILRSATGSDGVDSILKSRWSQNNRFKLGTPPCNSQKISFVVNVKDLIDEASTFKLAVHCKLSAQLIATDKYRIPHPFSIALTVEETLKKGNETNKLYSEMVAINEVESIIESEGIAEADTES